MTKVYREEGLVCIYHASGAVKVQESDLPWIIEDLSEIEDDIKKEAKERLKAEAAKAADEERLWSLICARLTPPDIELLGITRDKLTVEPYVCSVQIWNGQHWARALRVSNDTGRVEICGGRVSADREGSELEALSSELQRASRYSNALLALRSNLSLEKLAMLNLSLPHPISSTPQ